MDKQQMERLEKIMIGIAISILRDRSSTNKKS